MMNGRFGAVKEYNMLTYFAEEVGDFKMQVFGHGGKHKTCRQA